MPKPSRSSDDQPLFFIDKKGDELKRHDDKAPVISLNSSGSASEVIPSFKKDSPTVIVISSNPQSDFEVLSDDEGEGEDEKELIMFKGHPYKSDQSIEYSITDESCDDSECDEDYIQNLEDNGEDYMLEDLQKMNLDAIDASEEEDDEEEDAFSDDEMVSSDMLDDDEAFAELARSRNLLRDDPATIMEFSLDETAAEFLAQKRRGTKGHGKGKKKHLAEKPVQMVDPFVYDGPYTIGAINFRQINREMKAFLNDDVEDQLEFDPMPPLPRKFLHELAHQYGLKSKSAGQGRDRHCILYKTERSMLSRNPKAIKALIDRADQAVLWMDKSVTKGKKFTQASVPAHVKEGRVRGGKGKKGGSTAEYDRAPSAKPAVGTVIGQHAKPISADNVGNKMLQKMGWKPGQSLGSTSEGILNPVEAVVRGKRTGLGHGTD